MTDALADLSAQGVSIWLDDISRERLQTGNLQSLIDDKHVVGVTSNPTIFQKALAKGDAYDDQVRDLAVRGVVARGGRPAPHQLRHPVGLRRAAPGVRRRPTARTAGSRSRSIRASPTRRRRPTAEAKALWWLVDRPNVMIKIPATEAGLPAITAATAAGISVNVTLIFSLDRYDAVMEAYLTGLEQAQATGIDLSTIRSVASFFVSRVDTEIDKRLDKIGTDEAQALRGKAGIANARLAYQRYEEVFGSDRWKALARLGRAPRSVRCGPRPGSRTRPTTTRCTSSTWSRRTPSTPCRRRRWTRSPTTA